MRNVAQVIQFLNTHRELASNGPELSPPWRNAQWVFTETHILAARTTSLYVRTHKMSFNFTDFWAGHLNSHLFKCDIEQTWITFNIFIQCLIKLFIRKFLQISSTIKEVATGEWKSSVPRFTSLTREMTINFFRRVGLFVDWPVRRQSTPWRPLTFSVHSVARYPVGSRRGPPSEINTQVNLVWTREEERRWSGHAGWTVDPFWSETCAMWRHRAP